MSFHEKGVIEGLGKLAENAAVMAGVTGSVGATEIAVINGRYYAVTVLRGPTDHGQGPQVKKPDGTEDTWNGEEGLGVDS